MERALHLLGISSSELTDFVTTMGEPAYRARQLFAALHRRRLLSLDDITDLPKNLRAKLARRAQVSTLRIESRYVSSDGTRRYLMKTHDDLPVETVFIPEERRDTICFSSQSGCPLKCDFCLTAKLGLLRTLTAGEIVEQIIIALNDAYGIGKGTPRGTNLVAMGAGEPLLAFDSLMRALRVMAERDGLHIVPNRVNVSTAGIVPRIKDLAQVAERPHLAISLAAPTDELRDILMPINKRWPLDQLMSAARDFQRVLKAGERMTFEYVMLDRVNDSEENARQLANLINRYELRAKVNLIPHNPAEPLTYRPSTEEAVRKFKRILESKGIHAFVRRARGRDIYAACGQLAARQEQSNPLALHQIAAPNFTSNSNVQLANVRK